MLKPPASIVLLIIALVITACGTVATPYLDTRSATPRVTVQASNPATVTQVTVTPDNRSHPTADASGNAADLAAKLGTPPPASNPENGKLLFSKFQPLAGMACTNCHRADTEQRLVGPGLLNVAIRAAKNVDNRLTTSGVQTAQAYLRQAILYPSRYVVPGYQDLMPKTWGKVFSEQQLNDLIAYLMTLNVSAISK